MMGGNDQQAYDRGTSLFSPDGRIYQVEYAREAVSRGAPSVGVRTTDGVVFVAMSRPSSSLMEAESIEKLHKLDDHVGTASAGHVADARQLIDLARRQSQGNRLRYGEPVGVETLTKFITDHIQENTQRGGTRPYGAALLIGGIDDGEPRLFAADPSGTPNEWKATVIGGGRQDIQGHLEDEWSDDLSLEDGIELAVAALAAHDDEFEASDLAVATVTEADGFRTVPTDEVEAAVEAAGLAADEEDAEETDDDASDGDE
ncbi:archaeal proteasome endopeptidase complex subunit alpha [Halorubrum ezzemoulense]|jgi:proteasome alpha subunit|uniref:Proteasome subunit alpha n=2 Tax=Halorubrum ezzemoulense TaxID=337243 RepID=A0A238WEN0_HALEZ|nr:MULTISPECIES: archaeal proteasome endopeptidase complex subunit alpha [Halorubrum]MDB2224077.1 archaeal proteasome endopeptidase complex subunit alpha [Halorubrum ezzemoulense]MDB2240399.1 archaeal proteasome endopeptidase complex subunit alpha [Halorubrum ezzemoulense]MDB2264081.1 archaeal proteasome endopeptidase complex subunit alpha [Halorubrum ezzemoulense]MDB2269435.1 archaeal proteasome endopeptidase complex subunit alpha [Halorubrum ezzemoulense]MDB2274786.1 archaeal proteasome endo